MALFEMDTLCAIDSNGRFVVSPFASVVRTGCLRGMIRVAG